MDGAASSRTSANARLPRTLAELLAWAHERPRNLGQLLLLSMGAVVLITGPLFADDEASWITLAAVTFSIALFLVITLFVPWSRLPRWSTLAMPLGVMAALTALGAGGGLASPYTGFLVLCFAYTGLTQSSRANTWLVLPAAGCYLVAVNDWSTIVAVRLIIVIAVWILLSQLLCALMTRHEALTDNLRSAAFTDLLTGLPNRRALDARLAQAHPGDTVALCDIDLFKDFNDSHGHLAGDRLLAEFGRLLRGRIRTSDYAARYGGEEFALVLPDTDPDTARAVVGRLRADWARVRKGVTFSTGLATYERDSGLRQTLQAADDALYQAKAEGRNRDVYALPKAELVTD